MRRLLIGAALLLAMGAPSAQVDQRRFQITTGEIVVSVKDSAGKPVSGVAVQAVGSGTTRNVQTAADGRAGIYGLTPGWYDVLCSVPIEGRSNPATAIKKHIEVAREDRVEVRWALGRDGSIAEDFPTSALPPDETLGEITGTVTLMRRDGSSVHNDGTMPGVTVELFGSSSIPIDTTHSNADGVFSIRPSAFTGRIQPPDLERAARDEEELFDLRFSLINFDRVVIPSIRVASGTRVVVNADLDFHPVNCNGILAEPGPPGESVCAQTPLGGIFIEVDTEHAPVTSANFLKYVDAHLYDGGRFYRVTRPDNYTPVLPDRPMMNIIQGGIDPAGAAKRFPPVPLERTSVTGLKHVAGAVSMARGTPDSATSEFFILLDDQPSLDFGGKRFADGQGGAVFGHVGKGMDVVRKIDEMPASGQNLTPVVPIVTICRTFPGDVRCR